MGKSAKTLREKASKQIDSLGALTKGNKLVTGARGKSVSGRYTAGSYAKKEMPWNFAVQGSVHKQTIVKPGSLMKHINIADLHTVSPQIKINMIKDGISKDVLVEIKDDSDLDYDTLSNMFSVSRATLINKKKKAKFDQATSERIMLFADVLSYGKEVFEDKSIFNHWLKKPSKAFNNQTPLAMMDTVYGIQEVKNELGRIEYGVF